MNLAIQDGQKTRKGPLVEAGICTVSGKERKGFLKRGDPIVLGTEGGHRGGRVTLRETTRARWKSDAGMSCSLKGWVSPQWGPFIETELVTPP